MLVAGDPIQGLFKFLRYVRSVDIRVGYAARSRLPFIESRDPPLLLELLSSVFSDQVVIGKSLNNR